MSSGNGGSELDAAELALPATSFVGELLLAPNNIVTPFELRTLTQTKNYLHIPDFIPDILGLVFPIVPGLGPFIVLLALIDGFLLKAGAPGVWIVDAI